VKHVYATAGEYLIQLNGIVDGFTFNDKVGHQFQILDISQWGCVLLEKKRGRQFIACSQLHMTALDTPDLTGITNMDRMFYKASSFNGDVSQWNTENVTNMERMFAHASSFNGDVSQWNTGNVTNMESMFFNASSFNGDVSQWNTGSVTNMTWVFCHASSFNMDLVSGWNLVALTHDRADMFR